MKLFLHLALDRFGAECLGRAQGLLAEVAAPERERHRFFWAGGGDPPAEAAFWARLHPAWDGTLALPAIEAEAGAGGPPPPRQQRADAIAAAIRADGDLGRALRALLDEEPVRVLGPHQPYELVVSLSASLADPERWKSTLIGVILCPVPFRPNCSRNAKVRSTDSAGSGLVAEGQSL